MSDRRRLLDRLKHDVPGRAHPLAGPVIIEAATVLAALKVRPGNVGATCAVGAPADLDRVCARLPVILPVGAKEALRRGRTKEGPVCRSYLLPVITHHSDQQVVSLTR
jgi:hypothetical protein